MEIKNLSEQEKMLLLDSLTDKLKLLEDDIKNAENDILLTQILIKKINNKILNVPRGT